MFRLAFKPSLLSTTLLMITSITLGACSSQTVVDSDLPTQSQNTDTNQVEVEQEAQDEAPAVAGQFSEQELEALLTAEFAGQRNNLSLAKQKYLEVAASADSAAIAMRAMQIAQFTGDTAAALKAAHLWIRQEPENADAHWHTAQLYLSRRNYAQALFHINEVHRLNGDNHYELLATTAAVGPEEQRYDLQSLLMEQSQQDDDNPSLWTALAILNQSLGLDGIALQQYDQALSLDPTSLSAAVFKARLLAEREDKQPALDWINTALKNHPDHKGLKVMQARLLLTLGSNNGKDALQAFEQLHEDYPQDETLLLSLGLIEFDLGMSEQSESHLRQLLAGQAHRTQALYYLGKLEERRGNPQQALEYFIQVTNGREFIPAQLNASSIIIETNGLDAGINYLNRLQKLNTKRANELKALEANILLDFKQYDEALLRFNQLLEEKPQDADLLFSRALVWEQLDRLDQMEADLRKVIEQQPDNANALNALGYTLVDKLDRAAEALPMLQKAAALEPQNAAILDSLGWAYFKLGQYDDAVAWLQQAHKLMLDDEIAAHYGEALWYLDKPANARKAWRAGLKHRPDSQIIQSTLERHGLTKDDL